MNIAFWSKKSKRSRRGNIPVPPTKAICSPSDVDFNSSPTPNGPLITYDSCWLSWIKAERALGNAYFFMIKDKVLLTS